MKTLIFTLIGLLGLLLISIGYKKNNGLFKAMGFILLIPILFGIGSVIYNICFV